MKSFALLRLLPVVLGLAATLHAALVAQPTPVTPRWAFTTLNTVTPGAILSSPALDASGNVFFGVEIGDAASGTTGAVFSLKPNGQERWRFTTKDWVDATPVVGTDGTCYFGDWDGGFYAVGANGRQVWSVQLGGFVASSAALGTDGAIYVGCGDGNLYALNPDGTERWRAPVKDWIDASPVIGPDGTIYVGSWDNALHAFGPDGVEKWRHNTGGDVVSSVALDTAGTIYFGSRDHGLYAIGADGHLVWRFVTGGAVESSPVIAPDGTVITTSTDGRVYAVDALGRELWRYPAAGLAALGPLYSTPALRADGSVLVGTSDATLIALNAKTGALHWSQPVGDWLDSSPVVGPDGSVYVGCFDKKLYAFDGSSPSDVTAWPQARRDARRTGQAVFGRAEATAGRLYNLSVRAVAGSGSETLIAGFGLGGAGQRDLLVRGTGPALRGFGVSGVIDDPELTAFTNGAVVAANDNWEVGNGAQDMRSLMARLGGFALLAGGRDAALSNPFGTGPHSVHLSDRAKAKGVALIEVYDGGGADTARLVNLSARTYAGKGAEVLTLGFTITGGTRSLLVRAVGPTLANFSVSGVIADPTLRLFRDQEVLASNDDWNEAGGTAVATAAAASGAFSLAEGAKDSALLVTLPAGGYTAVISGADGGTGIALVELYEVL